MVVHCCLCVYFPYDNGLADDIYKFGCTGLSPPDVTSKCTDDLLMELAESGVGCHWDGLFVGALAYADDLTLLAPSPSALRMLLRICERFGLSEVQSRQNTMHQIFQTT